MCTDQTADQTSIQDDDIEVFHNVRDAAVRFGVAPATMNVWAKRGRVDATHHPSPSGVGKGNWEIRVPPDHTDLPENRTGEEPVHHPRVEEASTVELARLRAENARLLDEVRFLRELEMERQRQLPQLVAGLVAASTPSLPEPVHPKPRRWYWLWLA